MTELRFETGLVTFSLNGAADVTFNPTDPAFVERLYNVFESLDKKQDEYDKEKREGKTNREMFDYARKIDSEMRSMVDEVFDAPICEPVFGTMNVYAMADGMPVWANMMFAILDVVNKNMEDEGKKINPRIEEYKAKYKRK